MTPDRCLAVTEHMPLYFGQFQPAMLRITSATEHFSPVLFLFRPAIYHCNAKLTVAGLIRIVAGLKRTIASLI